MEVPFSERKRHHEPMVAAIFRFYDTYDSSFKPLAHCPQPEQKRSYTPSTRHGRYSAIG
jgi:hypothetical protein